ncbi:AzlD domain-containing protein [Streptosporangium nondiastaticum]|uniref:AzlD domain-containing protein n=2 Tax=Actinomycetes TaxID=1760 RepID=A0A9X7JUX0_9ACTN|nr:MULTISPECIES: AzlD domain-containing protein [Actinomycetes]MCF3103548.1 AzlD domain-containing protein [Streptomyces roseoverticillatus]PSJ30223.1 AzlD domain-containing protein [Streptosporangium nondiastaticum]
MTGLWLAVLLVGAVSMALKATGPVLLGGEELPAAMQRVVTLMAPTLLAALIATQMFGQGRSLVIDARAVGLVVGAFGVWRKWPTLLVVVLGAAATALTRLVTG